MIVLLQHGVVYCKDRQGALAGASKKSRRKDNWLIRLTALNRPTFVLPHPWFGMRRRDSRTLSILPINRLACLSRWWEYTLPRAQRHTTPLRNIASSIIAPPTWATAHRPSPRTKHGQPRYLQFAPIFLLITPIRHLRRYPPYHRRRSPPHVVTAVS